MCYRVRRCLRDSTFSRFSRTPTCDKQTDGQTDGQTDIHTHDDKLTPALAIVAPVKTTARWGLPYMQQVLLRWVLNGARGFHLGCHLWHLTRGAIVGVIVAPATVGA